jgi:hypothetical protein
MKEFEMERLSWIMWWTQCTLKRWKQEGRESESEKKYDDQNKVHSDALAAFKDEKATNQGM